MAFTPTSRVYLLDTPLDNTYKNQIDFASTADQYNYFIDRQKHKYEEYSYIRKDNVIKVGVYIDDINDSNYVMYQNKNYGTKWFYAFITKKEYINPNCTYLYIETDVYQTWLMECQLLQSFVVREHVNSDNIGDNIIDEGLDYGEYVFKKYMKSNLFNDISFVVAVSDLSVWLPTNLSASARVYDNLVSGLVYWVFASDSITNMTEFLQAYDTAGKPDAVEFIFSIPSAFLPNEGQLLTDAKTNVLEWNYECVHGVIDGYIPKNKKLYCYPYNVLAISNNVGGSANYRFEDFSDPTDIVFKIECNLGPNPTVVCSPRNFKNHLDFNSQVQEYALTMNGYPLCSWKSDVFRAWIAQNGLTSVGSAVAGVAGIAGGIISANPVVAGGGVLAIYSQLASTYKTSIQPDQAKGNTQNGSFNIAHGRQDFYLSHLTIKKEYAKAIDNYFSMFGYKVNEVKVPNVTGRQTWNYVKTIDVNIDGHIPDDDMNRLKQMYNDGVTFWHIPDRFCRYDYPNNIL
jgi:hypothetical protein